MPSVCTDLCFKQVFKIATADCNTHCCSVNENCELQLPPSVPVTTGSRSRSVNCDARFTGERLWRLQPLLTPQPSINKIHVYIKLFYHKDVGIISCRNVNKSWITLYLLLIFIIELITCWERMQVSTHGREDHIRKANGLAVLKTDWSIARQRRQRKRAI